MSEKIYAWLLRLYPSHFLEAYGDEALQLFRDRARNDTGLLRALRLWFDLLADLVVSLPRQHRQSPSPLIGAAIRQRPDSMPSFLILAGDSLRPGALLLGGVLSLASFGLCSILIGRAGQYRPAKPLVALFVPASGAAAATQAGPPPATGATAPAAPDAGRLRYRRAAPGPSGQ